MGQAGRALVELGEGQPLAVPDDGLTVPDPVGDALEEVGEIELHAADATFRRCGSPPTASSPRSATPRGSSSTSRWSGSGHASGRSPAARRSSRAVGDYVEYVIGDQSILVVRIDARRRHRVPQRLPPPRHPPRRGRGHFADGDDPVPLPRVALRARRPDRRGRRPRRLRRLPARRPAARRGALRTLGRVRVRQPRPRRGAAARLPRPAPRAARALPLRGDAAPRFDLTTILPANWKVVVDAFNEAYHVQGTHPQLLPWTDDVSIEYEQLGNHAHYGRLPNARRLLRPSPRLGLTDDEVDEGAILRGLVERARRRVPEGGARPRRRADRRNRSRRARAARGVPGAPHGAARRARPRRLRVRTRPDDERRRRLLVPEHRRTRLPGQRDPLPRPPDGPRPRPRDPGHVGPRVAPPRRRVARCPSGARSPTGRNATGA